MRNAHQRFAAVRRKAELSPDVIAAPSRANRLYAGTGLTSLAGATTYSFPLSSFTSATGDRPGTRGAVVFCTLALSNTLVNATSPSAFSAITAVGAWALGNRNARLKNAWMP